MFVYLYKQGIKKKDLTTGFSSNACESAGPSVVLWYCLWYLVLYCTAQYIYGQGPEVTQGRYMGYKTRTVGNLIWEVVGKTREKSILRVWSAQVSALVCLVAFAKC